LKVLYRDLKSMNKKQNQHSFQFEHSFHSQLFSEDRKKDCHARVGKIYIASSLYFSTKISSEGNNFSKAHISVVCVSQEKKKKAKSFNVEEEERMACAHYELNSTL
jgi:hypothetical protein